MASKEKSGGNQTRMKEIKHNMEMQESKTTSRGLAPTKTSRGSGNQTATMAGRIRRKMMNGREDAKSKTLQELNQTG